MKNKHHKQTEKQTSKQNKQNKNKVIKFWKVVKLLFFFIVGNDEVVKALIFDGVVTNDFENQKSPRRNNMA